MGETLRYLIDATRGGDTVNRFLKRWRFELTDGVKGVILDFGLNKQVDDLCRRIAADPDLSISSEPRALRALLAARVMLFLANTTSEPEAELMTLAKPPQERELLGMLFGRMIAKVRLPREWNGQPYENSGR